MLHMIGIDIEGVHTLVHDSRGLRCYTANGITEMDESYADLIRCILGAQYMTMLQLVKDLSDAPSLIDTIQAGGMTITYDDAIFVVRSI